MMAVIAVDDTVARQKGDQDKKSLLSSHPDLGKEESEKIPKDGRILDGHGLPR